MCQLINVNPTFICNDLTSFITQLTSGNLLKLSTFATKPSIFTLIKTKDFN